MRKFIIRLYERLGINTDDLNLTQFLFGKNYLGLIPVFIFTWIIYMWISLGF